MSALFGTDDDELILFGCPSVTVSKDACALLPTPCDVKLLPTSCPGVTVDVDTNFLGADFGGFFVLNSTLLLVLVENKVLRNRVDV